LIEKNCSVYKNDRKIEIEITDRDVILPNRLKKCIENNWEECVKNNPSLFNGLVFSIDEFNIYDKTINIKLAKSNYAHYTYMLNHKNNCEILCKMIAVGGLIKTKDNMFLLGKMSQKTSFPGIVQCIGGGVSKDDFMDNRLNMISTLQREIYEETGIIIRAKFFKHSSNYIIVRGDMELFGICYLIEIPLYSFQLNNCFLKYKKGNMYDGELDDLVFVENSPKAIIHFLSRPYEFVDYLGQLLFDAAEISPLPNIWEGNNREI